MIFIALPILILSAILVAIWWNDRSELSRAINVVTMYLVGVFFTFVFLVVHLSLFAWVIVEIYWLVVK